MKNKITQPARIDSKRLITLIFSVILVAGLPLFTTAQSSFYNSYHAPWFGSGAYVKSDFSKQADGVYSLIGTATGPVDSSILLMKTDTSHQLEFEKRVFGPPFTLPGNQLMDIYGFNDSLIRLLFTTIFSSYILKTNAAGNLLNAKSIVQSSAIFNELFEVDGQLLGVGSVSYLGIRGGLICKMDMDANVLSSFYINSGVSQRRSVVHYIHKTPDGGFLIAGEDFTPLGTAHVSLLLMRTDSAMNLIWQHHYSRPLPLSGNMIPKAILDLPQGGFILLIDNAVNYYSGIMVTDNSGNVISYNSFNTTHSTIFPFLHELSYFNDSTIITAGTIEPNLSSMNSPVILSLDTTGQLKNIKVFPSITTEPLFATDVRHNKNQGLLFSSSRSIPGSIKANVIRTDTLLEIACTAPAFSLNPVNFTTIDSTFIFTIDSINITTYDVSSQFHILPVTFTATEYCVPSAVFESEEKSTSLQLFPNPAGSSFTVGFKGFLTQTSGLILQIYNALGKQVVLQPLSGKEEQIDISGLTEGIYTACVQTTTGNICGKLVILKP
ncbi:MAG: T9SS type A sorting domain-containing protein [Bacteroidetes bacterium]|nr:T9SS type A sorting domain-containing protein [Bacteroidota bacterium]